MVNWKYAFYGPPGIITNVGIKWHCSKMLQGISHVTDVFLRVAVSLISTSDLFVVGICAFSEQTSLCSLFSFLRQPTMWHCSQLLEQATDISGRRFTVANPPHAAAAVDRWDGQTDGRTLYRYVDPSRLPHTMPPMSIKTRWAKFVADWSRQTAVTGSWLDILPLTTTYAEVIRRCQTTVDRSASKTAFVCCFQRSGSIPDSQRTLKASGHGCIIINRAFVG